jgi:DNA helicase TIP49 (TBP-interacting protein)
MPFSKAFPRRSEKAVYPRWEDVELSEEEEKIIDENARKENIELMKECIEDAKAIINEKGLNRYQTDMINIAIALFEKRASHSVYHKERKAKEKFNLM